MELLLAILALITVLLTTAFLLAFFYNGIRYVPFVPTKEKVIKQAIESLKLKEDMVIYDLGCGDGRFLTEAVRKARVKAVGVEISRAILLLARLRAWLYGVEVQFLRQNFFSVDLKDADIVFCYLFPKVMERLKDKFSKELKPGAIVVSYSFPMKDWKPVRIEQTIPSKPKNFLLYFYQIGISDL